MLSARLPSDWQIAHEAPARLALNNEDLPHRINHADARFPALRDMFTDDFVTL